MKDLYIKPEVELKKFNMMDVISTSGGGGGGEGTGSNTNDGDGWSGFYDDDGNPIDFGGII